jgi:poly-gamma-glutamate capsule biosynthesis protein CapA/YwtB (metallophosphatase superfamily)
VVARPVQPRVPASRGLSVAARAGTGALVGAALLLGLACGRGAPGARTQRSTGTQGDGGAAAGTNRSTASDGGARPVAGPTEAVATPAEAVHAAIAAPPAERLAPELERAEAFELTFVGDVILGRYRGDGYDPIPDGEHEPFAAVTELLRSDLVVGNLETPLVRTLPAASPVGTRYSFGADAALARHLVPAGFHALSLANNHAYDMLATGVEETPAILAELGITPLGAASTDVDERVRVETIEREGWRVGFVAVTTQSNVAPLPGLPLPLVETAALAARVAPLVEEARVAHDLVVVLVHWGLEYADEPDWVQQQAARALVEAGADLVIGHHPHVLQGIERHGHGLIAYSLGNFLFENVKEIPRQTGVLRVRYDGRGCMEAVVLHPAFVKSVPIKHPAPATGWMAGQVRERVRALSKRWGTRFRDEGEDLVLEGLECPGGERGASGLVPS